METVYVKVSPKQKSKLRNGHKVRIQKPEKEGEGVCMIVHPDKYDIITKTFRKNKGLEVQLSPEELAQNKTASPELEGKGLWSNIGNKILDKGIDYAFERGIPLLEKKLSGGAVRKGRKSKKEVEGGAFTNADVRPVMKKIGEYLNPKNVVELVDLFGGSVHSSGKGIEDANPLLWGYDLGHNVIGPALWKAFGGKGMPPTNVGGTRGMYRPPELTAFDELKSVHPERKATGGTVGKKGTLLTSGHYVHPALQSQPLGANYQFSATLPSAFQAIHKSGSGLYASSQGRGSGGLYA